MNDVTFTAVHALQILDSRGHPTLQVALTCQGGSVLTASAPSGASTGTHEAVELRDGGRNYSGRGVESAVAGINTAIAELLLSRPWPSQRSLDGALCELDGTADKSRLGANAIVAVSMAAARAFASVAGQPLHAWIGKTVGRAGRLPVPHFNVLNGGAHAANPLAFQEFMIAPTGARNLPEAIRWGSEVYHALGTVLRAKGMSTGLGDEGGYAPEISSTQEALELITQAIEEAGHSPGTEGLSIALDPAANYFYRDGVYELNGSSYSSTELVGYYEKLVANYPIRSLEDPLAEEDAHGWPELTARLGNLVQVVGDDIFVTNPELLRTGIQNASANAVLLKPNQIGTVSQTLDTFTIAEHGGFSSMVSHRSGETMDSFVADLAVGLGCGQFKSGAPARGERVAKYNRLLEISEAHPLLPYGLGTPHRETEPNHD